MTLLEMDSRTIVGTDIETSAYPDGPSLPERRTIYPARQNVRVILCKVGDFVRMSAPELSIVVDGSSEGEVWERFLAKVRKRDDFVWMRFDVGPTRAEEIDAGLDAPEDEDWSEGVDASDA